MCGGGGDNSNPMKELEITGAQKKDPASEARELHLWNQSQQFAETDPFTSQYGGASAMPGLSDMSQRGQQYLTDSILGKGQYGQQNLGFSDYSRPETAAAASTYGYTAGAQTAPGGAPPQPFVPPTLPTNNKPNAPDPHAPPYDPDAPAEPQGDGLSPAGAAAAAASGFERTPAEIAAGVDAGGLGGWKDKNRREREAVARAAAAAAAAAANTAPPSPEFGNNFEIESARLGQDPKFMAGMQQQPAGLASRGDYTPSSIDGRGMQQQPAGVDPFGRAAEFGGGLAGKATEPSTARTTAASTPTRAPQGGLLRIGDKSLERGVGMDNMEMGALATRRSLEEFAPQQPSYSNIVGPTVGSTQVGTTPRIGTSVGSFSPYGRAFSVGSTPTTSIGQTPITKTSDMSASEITAPDATGIQGLGPLKGLGGFASGASTRHIQTGVGDVAGPDVLKPEQVIDPNTGATVNLGPVAGEVSGALTDYSAPQVDVAALDDVGAVEVGDLEGAKALKMGSVDPTAIAGPQAVDIDPLTGQATQSVDAVAPTEFGGASYLGGPAIQDYMNQAGVEAQVAQARQDYEEALNREKSRQAQVGAFGSRGTVEESGLIGDQERNIAQIRGAGYDRAAQLMEADTGRRQQAGMQGQQLGVQAGLAGQGLEAQRRESDAARAQQAGLAGQQLGAQSAMQTQQLAQQGNIRGAELGLQASMQGQQLEAQRRQENAARAQQVGMQGQQLGVQSAMQTQQLAQAGDIRGAELGLESSMQGQQLEASRREANAARAQQAALTGQQLGSEAGLQSQQLTQQARIQTAQNDFAVAQANQAASMQTGTQEAQLNAERQMEAARLELAEAQQTQELSAEAGMQTQTLGYQASAQNAQNELQAAQANLNASLQTNDSQAQLNAQRAVRNAELKSTQLMQTQQLRNQAGMQNRGLESEAKMQKSRNQIEVAQSNMQAALQTGNQQAAINAQRQLSQAQMGLDAASRNQSTQLQAAGMGMDAQGQFRQQQLGAAQQLADIGGMRQGAAFGAADQLRGMGANQEQAERLQQAWDYEQWLRGQEGGAESLGLVSAMMPGGIQQQWQRKPDRFGQILGAATSLGGAALGSDIRMKENIRYVGEKNGHKLYEFNYLGGEQRYKGVMAQDLLTTRPDALTSRNGLYWVDYGALGLAMEAV